MTSSKAVRSRHWLVPLLLWLMSQHQPALALFCRALTPLAVCRESNRNHLGKSYIPKHKELVLVMFSKKGSAKDNDNDDSEEELESIRSWRSTSSKAKEAEIVFRAPSLLDANAFVEVKKRTHGWHSLGIVGGPTKSIYHGVFQTRTDERTGTLDVDPYALGPSEYIRTMASMALCLAAVSSSSLSPKKPLRFLHMGYGSGSLMRFLRHAIPNSQHEAIELDATVVEAATELGLVDPISTCERLAVGDALEYTRESTSSETPKSQQSESKKSPRFHGICIDVFDGANLMPPGFYAVPFLERLREEVLEQQDCSFVIHNFHVGTERLEAQLEDAIAAYRTVFGTRGSGHERESDNEPGGGDSGGGGLHSLYKVDSLNTNNHGGNTILIAILNTGHDDSETSTTAARAANTTSTLLELASLATERWGFTRFNVASRIAHAKPL